MKCLASVDSGYVLDIMDSKLTNGRPFTYSTDMESGMARIFTAAPALVKLMSGESWDAIGLPNVYQISARRLENLKSTSVARTAII